MIPLALLPYAPAAIAGIGAAAKGVQRYAPQIRTGLQGGMNLANRGLTSLQNISQPYLQNIANKFATSGPITGALSFEAAAKPSDSTAYNAAKAIVKGGEWILGSEERKEEIAKQFFEMFGIDIDQALIDAGTELIEKEKEKLKKGGYVKKQRKRKPYKSSAFVKMKKSKKRKYIKT